MNIINKMTQKLAEASENERKVAKLSEHTQRLDRSHRRQPWRTRQRRRSTAQAVPEATKKVFPQIMV